ncbi:hypothetical protein [Streptomyces sp. SID14478]|uniref:hypothetical protein n=1 Tax=Streptomyces sp. SID14478 TaxID=2706073 RepID=UPI001941B65F|nr:hypothetical protein [Streptomyces sp. SID14478]
MARHALPYRVPPDDVVDAGPWSLVTPDGEVPLPEAIDDWDYQMDLHLRRRVRIDQVRTRSQAGLPESTELMLSAVWTATGSNLRGPGRLTRLTGSAPATVDLDVHLRGADLGGLLVLDTALVLAERRDDARPAAPRRAGSVLWGDAVELRLQGDAPQFPMAVIDFSHTSFPNGAAWHIQIDGELDSAAMGSLLLLINERNTAAAEAFQNAARPRPVDRIVLSAVYADVARTMIEHALSQEDFVDETDYAEDSLGSTLLSLFHRLFPEQSITDVRLRRDHSPSVFSSELQAAVKIFEEPE